MPTSNPAEWQPYQLKRGPSTGKSVWKNTRTGKISHTRPGERAAARKDAQGKAKAAKQEEKTKAKAAKVEERAKVKEAKVAAAQQKQQKAEAKTQAQQQAVAAAGQQIEALRQKGSATPQELGDMVRSLASLRVADLQQLKAKYGIKASGVKPQMAAQIAERALGGQKQAAQPQPAAGAKARPELKDFLGDWEKDPANASKVRKPNGEPQETHQMTAVPDANGRPVAVYHGGADFQAFDKSKVNPDGQYGPGFYFTQDAEEAGKYAQSVKGGGGKVHEVYLNIRKPFNEDSEAIKAAQLPAEFRDRAAVLGKAEYDLNDLVKITGSKAGMVRALRAMGYDGISTEGRGKPPNRRWWIAFEPEQIAHTSAFGPGGQKQAAQQPQPAPKPAPAAKPARQPRQAKPAPAQPTAKPSAHQVETAIADAAEQMKTANLRTGAPIKVWELTDAVRKAHPELSVQDVHDHLMRLQDEDRIHLGVVNLEYLEPRVKEGIVGPRGTHGYVRTSDRTRPQAQPTGSSAAAGPAQSSPPAGDGATPSSTAQPKPAIAPQSTLDAFHKLNAGGDNRVSLADLHDALGHGDVKQTHVAVNEMRKAGVLVGSSYEGRHGSDPRVLAHSLRERGHGGGTNIDTILSHVALADGWQQALERYLAGKR